MTPDEHTGNLLLDSAPSDERARLLTRSHRHPNPVGERRRRAGDVVTSVLFPSSGALSLIVDHGDGPTEAATVGREGVVDVPSALGSRIATHTVLSHIAGESVDVDVDAFNDVYDSAPTFRRIMQAYVEALFAQASISVSCVAHHHVTERCARWLLESHDRVDADTFELKQESLAMMIGVHRPSVSVAAAALQTDGLIAYTRGKITILDREGLEAAACSCYEWVRSEYSRLVPLTLVGS